MVVSTCTGYDANLQYFKGEKPIRTTLKPVSVINLVACPYLEYINMFFCRLFGAMSHFTTFQPAAQQKNRFACVCKCKLKEN